MAITYNNLYLDVRQQFLRAGLPDPTLESRELVCCASGKTREALSRDGRLYVPESVAFYTDWVATIPWLWLGAGGSALAVAAAGLGHGAVPRWIATLSLAFGLLTVLAGASPFQYLTGFIAPVWLLVVSLGFALGDRR